MTSSLVLVTVAVLLVLLDFVVDVVDFYVVMIVRVFLLHIHFRNLDLTRTGWMPLVGWLMTYLILSLADVTMKLAVLVTRTVVPGDAADDVSLDGMQQVQVLLVGLLTALSYLLLLLDTMKDYLHAD